MILAYDPRREPATYVSGKLQRLILAYLSRAGERTTGDIYASVASHYPVVRETVTATLWRLNKAGWIERRGYGRYAIVPQMFDPEPVDILLVGGALDRLFHSYPVATEQELRRRGWSKRG